MSKSDRAIFFVFPLISLLLFFCPPTCVASYEVLSVDNLQDYNELPLSKVIGPESIAFDCAGEGPYVSVSDGRILKWEDKYQKWREFAFTAKNRTRQACDNSTDPELESTCGRPLGIKFNHKTCELYIADAYYGLLKVGPEGGAAEQLATSAGGVPFKLTNALDIDHDTGIVYFTDSSTVYSRKDHMQILETGDRSGRFMEYNPVYKNVSVLLDGLWFPNGVAISEDKSFVVVAITNQLQALKFWLRGPKANTAELFAQFHRFPDNIERSDGEDFWVAFNTGRSGHTRRNDMGLLQYSNSYDETAWFGRDVVAMKYRPDGSVAEVMDGRLGTRFDTVTDVVERNGIIWVGSVLKPYVSKFKA